MYKKNKLKIRIWSMFSNRRLHWGENYSKRQHKDLSLTNCIVLINLHRGSKFKKRCYTSQREGGLTLGGTWYWLDEGF